MSTIRKIKQTYLIKFKLMICIFKKFQFFCTNTVDLFKPFKLHLYTLKLFLINKLNLGSPRS